MRKRRKLKEDGYEELQDYAMRHIISKINSEKGFSEAIKWIPEVEEYFDSCRSFHEVGGTGYRIIQKCLKRFRDYKYISVNNQFRFQMDSKVSDSGRIRYVSNGRPGDSDRIRTPLSGTKADIYYLLNEAEQGDYAARRCREYTSSSKLHLTAIIVHILEEAVNQLMAEGDATYYEYGKLIYEAYMNPDEKEREITSLYDVLNMSKKKYYNTRGEAITLLSQIVFGVLPGEMGVSEFYIKDGEIVSLYE